MAATASTGAVIPIGARTDRPDYDYRDGLELRVFPALAAGEEKVVAVATPSGETATYRITIGADGTASVTTGESGWTLRDLGRDLGSEASR